ELTPAPGHLLGEGLLAPGQSFGDDDTGVVARLHNDAVQQVLDAHPRADLDEHLRAALAPGLLAHGEGVVQAETAFLEPLEDHEHGHQLAHRGRRQRYVRVLGVQLLAGLQVDQNRRPGRGLERPSTGCETASEQRTQEAEYDQTQMRLLVAHRLSCSLWRSGQPGWQFPPPQQLEVGAGATMNAPEKPERLRRSSAAWAVERSGMGPRRTRASRSAGCVARLTGSGCRALSSAAMRCARAGS